MTIFRGTMLALFLLALTAGAAFAQLPGEPKPPLAYDTIADMWYHFQRGAPDEIVREAHRVLRDSGYYAGPLDGIMGPEERRAIWNFQRARKLPPTGRLDRQTVAELGVAPAATAAQAESSPSALPP